MAVTGTIGEGVIQIAVAGYEAAKAKLEKLRDAATDAAQPVDAKADTKPGRKSAQPKAGGKPGQPGDDRGGGPKAKKNQPKTTKSKTPDKPKPTSGTKKPAPKKKPATKPTKPPAPKPGSGFGGMLGGLKGAGPMVAVTAALAAAGVAAKLFSEALSTVNGLVKAADPGRYAILERTLESTSIILGRQFIPLLQVAQAFMERVNNALRGMQGGGLTKFVRALAVGLERIVNAVWPAFQRGLEVANDLFDQLTPVIEELGGLLEEVFGGFAGDDTFGTMLRAVAGYMVQIARTALEIGSALWDAFGPILQGMFRGNMVVLTALYTALTYIVKAVGWVVSVVGTLYRIIYGIGQAFWDVFGGGILAVFEAISTTVGRMRDAMVQLWGVVQAVGTYLKSVFRDAVYALIGGINSVIEAINQMIYRLNQAIVAFNRINPGRRIGQLGYLGYVQYPDMRDNPDRRRPPPGAGDRFTNTPLMTKKPEFIGIEDAFKKAQQGAALDPAKLAERERMGLARDQLAATREVANNTRGRPAAETMF